MKKALLLSALTAISICFAGCGSVNTNSPAALVAKSDNAPTAQTAQTADEAIQAVTAISPSVEVQPVASVKYEAPAISAEPAVSFEAVDTAPAETTLKDWKSAYKEVLADYLNSGNCTDMSSWDIQDIDNDGTPELLISENQCHITGVMIYYYEDGKALPVLDEDGNIGHYGKYGGISIFPEEQLLGITDIHMGYTYTVILKYNDHKVELIQTTGNDSNAIDRENETVTYRINAENVSEEEYNEALDEFCSKVWHYVGNTYSFCDFSALD